MPLTINSIVLDDIPREVKTLYDLYPHFKDSARLLTSQAPKMISPVGLLYLLQREYAVVSPHDKFISIIGTDDATTCCSVALRHTASGIVALGHFDGSGLDDGVDNMVHRVKEYSGSLDGHIELHLVGGFADSKKYSQDLVLQLLTAFQRQLININLVTLCVCEMNNIVKGNINFPIVYGIGINVKTGEIFAANFPDKGPDTPLRHSRTFTGLKEMIEIYDTITGTLSLGPFHYEPIRGVDLWLSQNDEFILQHLSTSPEVEPPHFVTQVKRSLIFIQENPFPGITVFPMNRPRCYQKDDTGQWLPICFSNQY